MSRKLCCVRDCTAVGQKLHCFPNPATSMVRFWQWVEATSNEIVMNQEPTQTYNNYKICSYHFEDHCITGLGKLYYFAIPTINVPGVVLHLGKIASGHVEAPSPQSTESPELVELSSMVATKPSNLIQPGSSWMGISEPPWMDVSAEPAETTVIEKQLDLTKTPKEHASSKSMKTPKKCSAVGKKPLLRLVGVSRQSQSTPKAKALYTTAHELQRTAQTLNRKVRMSRKVCCVRDCNAVGQKLHCFPNPTTSMARFWQWVEATSNEIVMNQEPTQTYNNYRICSCHFEAHYNTGLGKLYSFAIPTINLPGIV